MGDPSHFPPESKKEAWMSRVKGSIYELEANYLLLELAPGPSPLLSVQTKTLAFNGCMPDSSDDVSMSRVSDT